MRTKQRRAGNGTKLCHCSESDGFLEPISSDPLLLDRKYCRTSQVGNLKGVGRTYQQTFIDTYTKVSFAKLYDRKTPINCGGGFGAWMFSSRANVDPPARHSTAR